MSGRKIIPTPKKAIQRDANTGEVLVLSSTDNLLGDSLSIIELELLRLKAKVQRGAGLDQAEGRLLNGYIKSLVELSKESRERAKQDDFSNMSNEELFELAEQVLKKKKDESQS